MFIEGSNPCVINSLKGIWTIPWEISFIIADIKKDLQFFDNIKITHTFREANSATDSLQIKGIIVLLLPDGLRVLLLNYRFSSARMS